MKLFTSTSFPRLWHRILLGLSVLWLTPILAGLLSAGYKIFLFRHVEFLPELEPDYVFWPALMWTLISALLVCVLIKQLHVVETPNFFHRLSLYALLLLAFGYSSARAQIVEASLVSRFAYCCCCMELPSNHETMKRVLSPFGF